MSKANFLTDGPTDLQTDSRAATREDWRASGHQTDLAWEHSGRERRKAADGSPCHHSRINSF